ncbi:MAG: NHLP bacteriocin system secretion protein [Clostridiales bacterium]|nr:NHLP bacteriocin system secretion protein [Clostridiales bacterium]MCF8022341.1 NHLP bacteriocin system secretion protein [Clostridiales bacterium]
MSDNGVFRKVSLDRLSSPEELDQRLTVTSPVGWLACTAVAMLILGGLIWGIFGKIPDKAVGQGIIISSGGIANVIHHASGQVTDVSAQEGDYVEKGDVIARVKQTGLIEDINRLKEDREVIRNLNPDDPRIDSEMLNFKVYGEIINIAQSIKQARNNLEVTKASLSTAKKEREIKLEQANWEVQQARLELEEDREDYESYKYLFDKGAVSERDFKEAERSYISSKEYLQIKQENLQNLQSEANTFSHAQVLKAEKNLQILKQQFKDTLLLKERELQKLIARNQEQLFNNSEIAASFSGRVLELQVNKGDMVRAGSSVCSIAREEKEAKSLEAVLYVPLEKGKKILPGTEVNISPTTVKKEEDGFMRGNVKSVSKYPASARGMMLTLGNQELVKRLSGKGAPIEVKVELIRDNSTVSKYKWSTPDGPDMVIDSGTLCLGEVKVRQQRPISMVIPYIKKVLPIYFSAPVLR